MTRAAPRVHMTTRALHDRLARHYLGTEMFAGGELATEVGLNNGQAGNTRRCDAVWVGFTSTWGRIMVGHELKTSRADWNRERDDPEKAGKWADACHAWYIVAPDTTLVSPDELPHGWGLLIPDPRRPTKMKTIVKAAVKDPHDPPWWAVRSVMARLNTLRIGELHRIVEREKGRIEKAAVEDYRRQQRILGIGIGGDTAMTPEQAADHRIMEAFRTEGVQLAVWRNRDTDDDVVIPTDLPREVRDIVRAGATAAEVRDRVLGRYHDLPRIAQELTALAESIRAMGATNGRP